MEDEEANMTVKFDLGGRMEATENGASERSFGVF